MIDPQITDEQIKILNSEVASIKEDIEPELLTLVTFDTEIQDTYVFEKSDPFEKLVITGRGGTDLDEVYDLIKKKRPSLAVIFTDLWVDIPPDPGTPILWVCTDHPEAKVPYGTLVHIDSE